MPEAEGKQPSNPHEGVIRYIADKHYGGQHLDKIQSKLLSDEKMFNSALEEFRTDHFPQLDSTTFSNKYLAKYGNPFIQPKPTTSETAQPQVGSNNDDLLKLIQSLNPDKFKDADKTKAYFSNPEKLDVAVEMLRQKHKPDADSAKFRAYIDKKYGSFAQPELQQAETELPQEALAPEQPSSDIQQQAMQATQEHFAQNPTGILKQGFQAGADGTFMLPEVPVESEVPMGTVQTADQSLSPYTQGGALTDNLDEYFSQMQVSQPVPEKTELTSMQKGANVLGAFNHAVLNAIPSVAETIAATSNQIDDLNPLQSDETKAKSTEDYGSWQAAQWMRGKIKELLPVDEEYQQSILPQIAGGLGQVTTIMLAAASGNAPAALEQLTAKAPSLLPAITQAAGQLSKAMLSRGGAVAGTQVFANEFRQAREAGASDDEAFSAGIKNAVVSSGLEQMPVMNALKRFNQGTGGGVVKWLKNTTVEASEEMVTEVASEFYANLNAQQTYDKNRELLDGLKEAGQTGYGTGFIMNGILSALGAKSRAATTKKEKEIIRVAIDETLGELENAQRVASPKFLDELGRTFSERVEEDGTAKRVYELKDNMDASGQFSDRSSISLDKQGNQVFTPNRADEAKSVEVDASPLESISDTAVEKVETAQGIEGAPSDSRSMDRTVTPEEQAGQTDTAPLPDDVSSSQDTQHREEGSVAPVKETVKVGRVSYSVEQEGSSYKVINLDTGKVLTNADAVNYKKAVQGFEAVQNNDDVGEMTNSLVSRVRSLNDEIRNGSKTTAQRAEVQMAKLNDQAERLELVLEPKKAGLKQFQLRSRLTGEVVKIKNKDTPTAESTKSIALADRSQKVQDFVSRAIPRIKDNPVTMQGMGLSFSRDSDINGAVSDIEKGKNTMRANELLDKLELALQQGFIGKRIHVGGGMFQTGTESLPDFLGEGKPEEVNPNSEQDEVLTRALSYAEEEAVFQSERAFETLGKAASTGAIVASPIPGGKPKPLREIMLDMSKAAKGKVSYSNSLGRRRALGTYNPRNAAIKIRYKNDLNTTAHELGHSLDDQYGLLSSIPSSNELVMHAELMQLAPGGSKAPKNHPDPQGYELGEGVAEYIRSYMINPDETKLRAPEFTAWFKQTIPDSTRGMIDAFSNDIRTFIGASAHNAIMANVEMQPGKEAAGFFSKPESGNFGLNWMDRLSVNWYDSLLPLKKSILFARAQRDLGALRPSKDPYILAENLAGHNDKLNRIFEGGLVDARLRAVEDDATGEPMTLKWLFENLDATDLKTLKQEQAEVISYMVAERSLELIEKRIERDIVAALAEGKYVKDSVINSNPRFQHLTRKNDENKAKKDAKKKRISTSDGDIVTGIGGGILRDSDQAKRRLSDMEHLRQFDTAKFERIKEAARRYQAYADIVLLYAVEKGRMSKEQYNAVKQHNTQYVALNRILEASPEDEILVHKPGNGTLASAKGIADKKIKGSGATIKNPYVSLLDFTNKTIEESDRNDFKLAFRELFKGDRGMHEGDQTTLSQVAQPAAFGDKNTIKMFVDGQAEYWQLQEDVYKAFTNFDKASGDSYLINALSSVASLVRWTVTHSPVFALRNKVRDMQNWLVVSKSGAGKAFSFNKETRKEMRARYELFGGGQAGYYLKDEQFYYVQMEMAMEDMAQDKRFILADPKRVLNRGWERYKSLLSESETSTRLLEFTAAFRKAKKSGMDDYDASVFAAHEARDLMNFARAGHMAREMGRVIPFFNAAVQGLGKTLRTAKEDPKGMLIRWALFVAVPSALNRILIASFGEEEEKEYQQMPAYQRDLFYNFPVGDNKWLSIPKSFEMGVLGSGIDRLLDKAYYGNEKAFDGYAGSVARTTMPVDESAIAGPLRSLVEISANYDFFRQKSIVSPYEENKAVGLREGTARASALGQVTQKAFGNNIDARYIDHLISANTTYFGNWMLKLSDEIAGEDNPSRGFNLSDTGFIKQDPVYNSVDVQWVLQKAKELGLSNTKDVKELNRLLGEQFEAETAADKEATGKVARDYAEKLRAFLESIDAESIAREGKKVSRMPKS